MSKYQEFGVALKAFRVAANETIEDVSGAVEIDVDNLQSIEEGKALPPEDILNLLVLHFSLRDKEAKRLFRLAGYEETELSVADDSIEVPLSEEKTVVYTDMVHVVSNQYGVIINFVQGFGTEGKPVVVSRVGMSREHAKSVVELLQKSLERADRSEQG